MSRPPRRYIPLWIVACLTCGKDSSAPLPDEPGPPADVAGTWSFRETLVSTQHQFECRDQGVIAIAQHNADLTGSVTQTGECTIGPGYADNSGTTTIAGNVGAATVRFDFGDCSYRGDLFNMPRDSAGGTVECHINFGIPYGRVAFTGTWSAIKGIEHAPPSFTAEIVRPAVDSSFFVTGETFRLIVRASDDHKLHSVVYSVGAPMNLYDSIPTTDTTFVDTVDYVIPGTWDGIADVFVRVRDAAGGASFGNAGTLRVLNGIRRPFQTRWLIARAAGTAYDSARNVLYLAQPESAQVGVLSLTSMTLGPRTHLPMTRADYGSFGIDIIPGGDSVIVATPDSGLAILNRLSGAVTTVPIAGVTGTSNVVVTSHRHALVFGSRDSSGYTYFGIWDHDFTTGADTMRRDIGLNGHLNATAQLYRSPDQSRVFIYSNGAPACAYVYDVATDAFSACATLNFSWPTAATATTDGSKWLWGDLLLDSALNVVTTAFILDGNEQPPGARLPGLAPDGSVAYLPRYYGYDKVALPAGTVVERVRIPSDLFLSRATALPEGTRLLLSSDWPAGMTGMRQAILVDLTSPSVSSAGPSSSPNGSAVAPSLRPPPGSNTSAFPCRRRCRDSR